MSSSASSPKKSGSPQRPEVISDAEKPEFLEAFNKLVAKRAYELFEQFGRGHGDDLAHWLQAEREMATPLPDIRESGGWFTVTAPVPRDFAEHIKVCVQEDHSIICAEQTSAGSLRETESREYRSLYYLVRWPDKVDPPSSTAYWENQNIVLTARKATTTGSASPSRDLKSAIATKAGLGRKEG
jgi:HSP20 family molecular chaperone IbpA